MPYPSILKEVDALMAETANQIRELGGVIHYIDYAENKDQFRKPQTGMASLLAAKIKNNFGEDVGIDFQNSFMVGDAGYKKASAKYNGDIMPDGKPGRDFSNSDRLFAENLGISFYYAPNFFEWKKIGFDELIDQGVSAIDALNMIHP